MTLFKNKLKASLLHLALSITLVSLVIASVIYFWYPTEFLGISNFKGIALLIISIDLVLGPILTFVVYAPKKKGLKFDIAFIGLAQLSALAYGVHTLQQGHPLFIAYNHGGFNLVQVNEVTDGKAKYDEFHVSKLASPQLAFAKMPDDPELQSEIIVGVDLKGDPDIDKRQEYLEPVKNHLSTILKSSLDAVKLFDDEHLTPSSKKFLDKYGDKKDQFAYLPLKGISGDAIIVLDKKTAEMIGTINADPWKFAKKTRLPLN